MIQYLTLFEFIKIKFTDLYAYSSNVFMLTASFDDNNKTKIGSSKQERVRFN